MPLTKSAKKKLRQDKKRERQNRRIKMAVKNAIKEYKRKLTPSLLAKVYSLLDHAAKKNVFHANKVARLKSKLAKLSGGKTRAEHKKSTTKTSKTSQAKALVAAKAKKSS